MASLGEGVPCPSKVGGIDSILGPHGVRVPAGVSTLQRCIAALNQWLPCPSRSAR